MKRASIYITEDAAAALEAAVEQVSGALGGDLKKQVILSALIHKAAGSAAEVATELGQAQAAELGARLRRLQEGR